MKNRKRIFLLTFLSLLIIEEMFAQNADLILTNGKIFTSDAAKLYVQALAIKGNKIIATGANSAIQKLASSNTKQIDLKGKTVVPGFNDQHDHAAFEHSPAPLNYDYHEINVDGPSKAAILDSIALLLTSAKPGQWITGMIGIAIFHDTSMRRALDSLAPNNPVALQIWWGHGIVTNKKGLEAVGLTDEVKDPVGGWYEHNREGKIAAVQQNAQTPFWIAINKANPNAVVKIMEAFGEEQLRGGITSTLFMGTGFTHGLVTQVLEQASIPQRLRIVAWPRSIPAGRQVAEWPLAETHPTLMSTISGIKYVIDGSPMEGNALHKQASLQKGQKNGRFNYPLDTMKQIFKEALTSNRQLLMHITADSSFEVVLSLIQQTAPADKFKTKRIRIEHNCVGPISPQQRSVLKAYNILMMHTPKYCKGSRLRSLYDNGVMIGISPDGTTNPFFDIMMCTTMQSDSAENLTREQAVIAYTKNNAYAEFKEKEKGTLMPGMLADLAVLSQDIFTIPPQQLPATKSVLTIIDGKIVYQQID
ncbi:MAG: amidohydrolase family protein [Segetibacter sp.]